MGNWIFAHNGSDPLFTSKYHDAVFATGKDEGKLTKQDINSIATKLGVDTSKSSMQTIRSKKTSSYSVSLVSKARLHINCYAN
ncbi:hypothetical protein [Photobacterium leiognathi]|uniref:hypothetical protein n=1 Tax=Photobacterium leiognathi TaxID=553611 RepID=UPI002738F1B4|nr:hypothetical protein [Photobacterium leiognathi]